MAVPGALQRRSLGDRVDGSRTDPTAERCCLLGCGLCPGARADKRGFAGLSSLKV